LLPALELIELIALVADAACVTRTESPYSSSQHRILPYVAFNQDAFPNCAHDPPKCKRFGEKIMRHLTIERDRTQNRYPLLLIALAVAGRTKSFSLPKQAQVLLRKFQAQYQAFVRFAVTSSAALSAIALNRTWLLEPFTRGGLSL
jgi:hypothetical protein